MTQRLALITGASGQDGQLLTNQLLAKDWTVVGVAQEPGVLGTNPALRTVTADLADTELCRAIVAKYRPDCIFHLAAVSSVGKSWQHPVSTTRINAMSTVALLAAARDLARDGHAVHVVNASSAEIFAGTQTTPQTELTPICPVSPYGVAKSCGHLMASALRAEGVSVSNAILYPHESTVRSAQFVTRKITRGVAEIAAGQRSTLTLGNLDARRDWGWAPDYVDAMVRMAEHRADTDFIVATGQSHSVSDFVEAAFAEAHITNWQDYVTVDQSLLRPSDGVDLVGDNSRLRAAFGWSPTKTFAEVVSAMATHDLSLVVR